MRLFINLATDLYSYYQETCYYLDNLCVDFVINVSESGTLLLKWGLGMAHQHNLWVGTEAGPMGFGLYLKHGFKQVGWFEVTVHGVENRFPVLRLEYPS